MASGPRDRDLPTVGDTVPAHDESEAPTLPADSVTSDSTSRDSAPAMRYQLGELLGRGGMGEVRSARDEQIGRPVAIKRMRDADPSPDAVARFLREARIQGRLQHPAVVPVHEVSRDANGHPYFVMKQLDGTTLADVIARDDDATFSRQRVLRAFSEVCLAIEFAHTRGVVHRDLKPANIMLGDFGEVYVLDWGIARVLGEARASFVDVSTFDETATMVGTVIGTPGYMAPEQARGDDSDGRADVYSLGAILFEILAGEPLHPRDRAISSTLDGVEIRPSQRAPDRDIPPELDEICVTAVRFDRDERYATARELGDAVQRFLDGDRDTALRHRLADEALVAARAAFERGDSIEDRRLALRAAARSMALDPTRTEPAELVGRLMIEPPRETPAEVERALRAHDDAALWGTRKVIAGSSFVYLLFLPILYWAGLHVTSFFVGTGIVSTVILLGALLPTPRHVQIIAYVGFFGNAVLINLIAWATTPYLAAPTMAVVVIMATVTHPKLGRAWLLLFVMGFALLSPWLAELAGTVRPFAGVSGGEIALRTAASALEPTGMRTALVLFVVFALIVTVAIARAQANDRRVAQHALQIQSWQLSQLVLHAEHG